MRKAVSVSCAATLLLILFSLVAAGAVHATDDVRRISKEEMRALLDDPHTIIIDVRQEQGWQESEMKIKGAVHENPMHDERSWAGKYPKDKNIVLYCS